MGNGAQIDIFQLTARWHTPGQARHSQTTFLEHFRDYMGGGLALAREIGGQYDLFHMAIIAALR
jgi:hypothetical protein